MGDETNTDWSDNAIKSWTHAGIDCCVKEAPCYGAINGYVRLPKDLADVSHYDDPRLAEIEVNGGLTYCKDGWIGFDTLHLHDWWPGMAERTFGDGPTAQDFQWTQELVEGETNSLARQIRELTMPNPSPLPNPTKGEE